jgi:hypothetical protein
MQKNIGRYCLIRPILAIAQNFAYPRETDVFALGIPTKLEYQDYTTT